MSNILYKLQIRSNKYMIIPQELILEAKEKLGEQAATIIANDLELKDFDEKNLKSICPFHDEETPSFIWNSKNNSFHCFGSCNINYGIIDHYMHFHKLTFLGAVERLFSETGIEFKFGERGVRSRDYVYPVHEGEDDRSQVESYLGQRSITPKTLDAFDVQQDHGNVVFHYYDLNDVLKTVKYRPAKKVVRGENKAWSQKGADTTPLLYNMNRIDPAKPLVITEGEIDALSVYEAGYHNVVSVPFGAGNTKWVEENFDWLEQFEKIIIWSDTDEPGIKMRKESCTRLGVWRTLFVEIPEELINNNSKIKDANAVLCVYGKQTVLDLISKAQEMPVVGVTDLSAVDDFDLEKAPGLYSNLKPVDDLIYKFLFGSVVLLTGIKGSGKSTLLNQIFICEALNQGQDVFIFSGEMGAPIVKSWLELTMAGREEVTMKDNFIHIISPNAKKEMRSWYKERVWIYNQKDNHADAVLDRAVAITRKYGAKIWVIDNLMTLDIGETDGNVLQKQKEFIVKLVNLAELYNVLVVLVAHPRKIMNGSHLTSDDISGSSNLGNLVQYILSVRRYTPREKEGERGQNGKYKAGKEPIEFDVEVEALKNRITGKVGTADLYFDYDSYRFYSTLKELYKRYKWNHSTAPMPKEDPREKATPFEEEYDE